MDSAEDIHLGLLGALEGVRNLLQYRYHTFQAFVDGGDAFVKAGEVLLQCSDGIAAQSGDYAAGCAVDLGSELVDGVTGGARGGLELVDGAEVDLSLPVRQIARGGSLNAT